MRGSSSHPAAPAAALSSDVSSSGSSVYLAESYDDGVKVALKSGLNIPGVAESYDERGNLIVARYAKGLDEGQQLPPSSTSTSSFF